MTTTEQPSVAAMKLSKAQYIELCNTLRIRAQEAHYNARAWTSRALEAESRLAIYEPGDEPAVDPRAWMNRALLAESRLAILRAAYEPPMIQNVPRATAPPLTDASGNAEEPLPTTYADSE